MTGSKPAPLFHYPALRPGSPRYMWKPGPPDVADVAAMWTVHLPTAVPCVDQAGGKHDCSASVPSNPSDPILPMTSVMSHCKPGKTTVIHISTLGGGLPCTGVGSVGSSSMNRSVTGCVQACGGLPCPRVGRVGVSMNQSVTGCVLPLAAACHSRGWQRR